MKKKEYFLWLDCEMTGLVPEKDHILQLSLIITDLNLTQYASYDVVIKHEEDVLKNMNEWSQKHHRASGLINQVRKSTHIYSTAEEDILALIKKSIPERTALYLAGNSVYCDRAFLMRYMPKIIEELHYRIFDISSFKIIAHSKGLAPFMKEKKHTARSDIRESIEEYTYYLKNLFLL